MNPSFKREMGTPPNCSRWQEEVGRRTEEEISAYAPEWTGHLKAHVEATPHPTEASVRSCRNTPQNGTTAWISETPSASASA